MTPPPTGEPDRVPRLDPARVPAFARTAGSAPGATAHGTTAHGTTPRVAAAGPVTVLDYHTAGEPFRIVLDGLPEIPGDSVLARRRWAREHLDDARRLLMWEPRGHADMYGGIVVPPESADAVCGVLFLHNEGWSTMCGHGTIALGTALIEAGAVPAAGEATTFGVDAPCGPLRVEARVAADELAAARRDGRTPRVHEVAFENVPSFAAALDATLDVPGVGEVRFDVGYGGAFYAVLPAERLGVEVTRSGAADAVRAARALVDAGRAALRAGGPAAERLGVRHPVEADLSFLYGAILTGPAEDPAHTDRNLCVFAEGEVDRSPTGSGVSARLAIAHARGEARAGESVRIESVLGRGAVFEGRIVREARWAGRDAVIPEVRGTAHVVGRAEFVLDAGDGLGRGFLLPR